MTDSNRIKWRYENGQRVNCVAYHLPIGHDFLLRRIHIKNWKLACSSTCDAAFL